MISAVCRSCRSMSSEYGYDIIKVYCLKILLLYHRVITLNILLTIMRLHKTAPIEQSTKVRVVKIFIQKQ
jgi:hypothetical protein